MKNGLVSIIIPVHNSEKYLKECVTSALNQTYPDIEIIAVYDNFPDDSLKILKKFSNKITILSTKPCNVASARNQGIEQSKGEWIKLLDSDDVLYPNAVEELVSIGKNLKNKKNIILYSNFEKIDSKNKVLKKISEKNFNDLDQFIFNSKLLFFNFVGNPSSSLIHRSTITSYGMFNEKFNANEDWELWLRYCILYNCRLHLIPKFLMKYRKHSESLTSLRRKNLPKSERANTSKHTKESIICKLEPSLRKKYEIAIRQLKKEEEIIKNELEKTKQNLLVNQKKIKALSGLDVTSKNSVIRTSANFLFKTLTKNQKINRELINENKELRENMKKLRKKLHEFLPRTTIDLT